MSSDNEVKWGLEGKLSEANANEKYLYSRVMELETRNQKLEKKVKKLKKRKKELKEEVAKLRGTTSVQHIANDHDASTSDVEIVEEPNLGSGQSNLDEEQAVISAGVSKSRYFARSIAIKYSNFSRLYKKKGPFYKKFRCDKFCN